MIAAVRDPEALKAIRPLDLAAYLRDTGWVQSEPTNGAGTAWTRAAPFGEEFEVLLAINTELRDYPARMSEALSALEIVEERSQLEILSDLMVTSADVIRIPLHHENGAHGSVPIEQGVPFIEHVRDMMLAAACAALGPREYFRTRKPNEAQVFLENVRLGPSERGSYVLTVLSPVPPGLGQLPLLTAEPVVIEEPFERQVTRTLVVALDALRDAAARAGPAFDFRPLRESVRKGVSANLCDAVVGMSNHCGGRGLDIRVTWARTREAPADAPSRIRFTNDVVPVIQEASRHFKEITPEPAEITGIVTQLQRELAILSGPITVTTVIEGRLRKVRVHLAGEDHRLAIEAYEGRIPVRCYGELIREGGSFELRNPRGFAHEPDA